jgi:hypothetical protein
MVYSLVGCQLHLTINGTIVGSTFTQGFARLVLDREVLAVASVLESHAGAGHLSLECHDIVDLTAGTLDLPDVGFG